MENALQAVHSRSSNGTALYRKECPECGAASIVDKRKIGMLCIRCAAKKRRTHGLSAGGKLHPLYRIWSGIKTRCYNPKATHYQYYGGKGVTVHQDWLNDPKAFLDWAIKNGWKEGLEVDRIDSNSGYSPSNCRIICHQENSQKTGRIKTRPEQVSVVKSLLMSGHDVREAAQKAGVTYMVAWHISKKNSWSNIAAPVIAGAEI